VDDLAAFARLIDAVRPWLGDLVIVGGWAHRLHRFTSLAGSPGYRPITTKDADLAFGAHRTLSGNIATALKAAGFEQELSGDEIPPVAAYRLAADDQGFFTEFLTPLLGDGTKRTGQADATTRVAGITAQKLRHLELLLASPWTLALSPDMGVPVHTPAVVRVANPVSFIAQKLLIHGRRKADKRAQDALYVHDTLELFGGQLAALRALWSSDLQPTMPTATITRLQRLRHDQYGAVSDVHRAAVRIPQDRTLAPELLQARCAYGLEEVLGD
jgi:hypothetical protein